MYTVIIRGRVGNLSMFFNWAPSIISIYTVDTYYFGVTPCRHIIITFPVCIHTFTRAKINVIIVVCLYVFVLKSMLKSNASKIYAALVLLE